MVVQKTFYHHLYHVTVIKTDYAYIVLRLFEHQLLACSSLSFVIAHVGEDL